MARKESEGSFDDDSSFHEDPIPGLITGHDDNCYEINLVTSGGRTIAKRDDVDDDGEEDEDGEEDCVNFSTCDLLDMSSLWDELEALGVRTADIDEFMCRFGACESSDSGVESDCYVACYGDDDGGLPERKELYEALKRGRLVMVGKNNNNNNNNGKDPSLLAFIEAKVRRIRAWRASLRKVDDVGTPDSGIGDGIFVSAEEKARQHEEWKQELIKTEEEIQTLRQVLNAKLRHAADLKRKLGITAWKEFADDMNKGIVSVKESQAVMGAKEKIGGVIDVINQSQLYQKSTSAVKSMAEKTTSTLGGLGSAITSKFGDMRENATFKSFEERVSATVGAVKGKVNGSRSNSTQDFDDALKQAESKAADEAGDASAQLGAGDDANKM